MVDLHEANAPQRNPAGHIIYHYDARRQLNENGSMYLYHQDGNIFARLDLEDMPTGTQMIAASILRVIATHGHIHLSEAYTEPGVLRHFAERQKKDPEKFARNQQALKPYMGNQLDLFQDGHIHTITTLRDHVRRYARNYLAEE